MCSLCSWTRWTQVLVSGSFADDCICSGLVYFRATPRVAFWLRQMLGWMYETVYTHDQKTMSPRGSRWADASVRCSTSATLLSSHGPPPPAHCSVATTAWPEGTVLSPKGSFLKHPKLD